jgi:hypothetical protein
VRFQVPLSDQFRDSLGGIAYVAFWIVAVAIIFPSTPAGRIVFGVLIITCLLEFAQLWHPAWLEALRHTFIGRAVLGTTFDWSDFPAYFAGALLGWTMLKSVERLTGCARRPEGMSDKDT